ncbi:hypothetical protein RHGRI_004360 [Rhododendron griersonianum]|uniref:Uncharacterized protein n=1 Tax=Rhododendron griersonianum TaxID=479676 RepID=A0AAV6LA38_9ERIC|nr:hypothetical protein RHGRI_004360 [Rhododendron griersonianum]
MLADNQFREIEEIKAKDQITHAQPNDLIDFYHLKSRKGMSQLELEDEVSVEKQVDGKLRRYITIRSKTQGTALSLGDKCWNL